MTEGIPPDDEQLESRKSLLHIREEKNMNQEIPPVPPTPPAPMPAPLPEEPKRNNTWLIVGIVVIVLCCCCTVAAALLWQYGDQILKALGQ